MLNKPLRNLTDWVNFLYRTDIPVLRRTVVALDALREASGEQLNVREIAEIVYRDPLMTLKVLAYMSTHRGARQLTDIETIEQAIAMMGVPPFFRRFSDMKTVEDGLRDNHDAHLGLMRVVTRAYSAAQFAQDWATRRQDLDFAVIVVAALLHDFAEMLIWCFSPSQALTIRDMQKQDPTLRSVTAQQAVIGCTLNELELALMKRWRLPELVVKMTDRAHAEHPQVRNVQYAVNLARHCANGWHDPALPDDFRDIARLLNTTPEFVRELVHPHLAATTA
jgi:HD-like signal output (HDOD) protein